MKKKLLQYAVLIVLIIAGQSCSTVSIPVDVPVVRDDNGGKNLVRLTTGRRNIAILAKPLDPKIKRQMHLDADWSDMVEGEVQASLKERGFFTIVDLGNRKSRLRELAYSQSGLTDKQLLVGNEIQADLLLILSISTVPVTECGVARQSGNILGNLIRGKDRYDPAILAKKEEISAGMKVADFIGSGGGLFTTVAPILPQVGFRDTTVFVKGTLINIETGESVAFTNSEPYRLESSVNSTDCPSELKGLNGALQYAAYRVAYNVSPEVVTYKVPVEVDIEGVPDEREDEVAGELEKGYAWAKAGNYDRAFNAWKKALNSSSGKSVSALWNIATYSWHKGQLEEAESYFEKVMDNSGPDWLDDKKRKIMTLFEDTKKKLTEE